MARYLYTRNNKPWHTVLKWAFIPLLLVIAVVVVVFIYQSGDKTKGVTGTTVIDSNSANQSDQPVVEPVTTQPMPKPPETAQETPKPPAVEPVDKQPEPNQPQITETTSEPIDKPNAQTAKLIDEALTFINEGPTGTIKARDTLNDLLHSQAMNNQQRQYIKTILSGLANRWLFSRIVIENDTLCSRYKVKRGDLLVRIGKEFKVPWEILGQINNIPRPELLRADQTIKVIHGPFHARVHRSTFTMDVYLQHIFVRSFPVGLAKPGKQTPTGRWIVKPGQKMPSPPWTDPDTGKVYHPEDPDYPLGSVWIGLEGIEGDAKGQLGYGIHGTKEPESIGTASSRGCIRLHNGDAIRVYNLLVPTLSRIEVTE